MTAFIDVHVHPPVADYMEGPFGPYIPALETHFRRKFPILTAEEIADEYRAMDGRAVLLAWDAATATRRPPFPSARIAEMVGDHPDVFIGFGSVDPHRGAAAVAGVHEAARLGMRGLKFHPSAQRFTPNDREFFPIWEVAEELGLICLFHTGFTGLGAGVAGGMGVVHRHANPLHLDEVAAAFPGLTVVMAHPSWPWQEEALAVAQHKTNVYLELSGWSPKLFGESLRRAILGPLQDRTLFGSDYPFVTPAQWLRGWETLEAAPDVTRKILHDNAAAMLGF